jgi:hypothetical protein
MTKVVIDMTVSLDGFVAGRVRLEKISAVDGPLATHVR